jgi:magnesium-protoporphyrin IX monomethyl ester (oxidative) cyclase
MKVHLVFAPTTYHLNQGDLGKGMEPSLGVLYLASYLREFGPEGVDIKITDGLLEGFDKTLEEVLKAKADIVGISAGTTNIMGAYRLTKEIKGRLPSCKVILGGPHPTALPEEAFEMSTPDAVAIGEGEVTFTEFVSCCAGPGYSPESLARIDGLCILVDGRPTRTEPREFIKDIDSIPFPARDLVDMKRYSGYPIYRSSPSATILTSRGCPFKCTYCSNNVWRTSTPRHRVRSPKNIADEIQHLHENDGINELYDYSDEFNTRLSHSKKILKEIISRNMSVSIKTLLRAKPIDEEFVRLMKEAGIWYIHLGIESGNERTLKGIRKMVTLQDIENCCSLLKKYDIQIWGLFMYFNIWEEDGKVVCEDYDQSLNTLNYAKRLLKDNLIDHFGGTITTPYPGSELWDIATRHALIKEECKRNYDMWFYKRDLKLISHYPGISEFEVFRLHQKTVTQTMKAMVLTKALRLSNLGYMFYRGLYFAKRHVLLTINRLLGKQSPR